MHNVQPQIQALQAEMSEARKMGDHMEGKYTNILIRKKNHNSFNLFLNFFQLPG